MNESYLVTGGTGFIGANIVRTLIAQHKHVVLLVRNKKLNWRLADIAEKLDIFECDLLDNNLQDVISEIKPQYIFHLAAYGALPNEENQEAIFDINIKGTMRLINAAKKYPFKLFVNTGSNSEYGIKEIPMKESDIPEPVNDYGVSKTASTLYAKKEAIKNNLPIITLRLFSAYGFYEEPTRFIPWVIIKALQNESIALTTPTNVRNFTFIQDIVDAYLTATTAQIIPGDIINIAGDRQCTLEEAVSTIIQLTKSTSELQWGLYQQQSRQIEKGVWQADITHAKKALGWMPTYSLEKGLADTIAWMRKNKNFYDKE